MPAVPADPTQTDHIDALIYPGCQGFIFCQAFFAVKACDFINGTNYELCGAAYPHGPGEPASLHPFYPAAGSFFIVSPFRYISSVKNYL